MALSLSNEVDEKIVDNTNAYLAVYIVILLASFLIITLDGFSIETNISAVLACFNNIGPGLDRVGPALNYANYSTMSKAIMIFCMLAGLVIVPAVSMLFKAPDRDEVDSIFSCYQRKVIVAAKDSIETEE